MRHVHTLSRLRRSPAPAGDLLTKRQQIENLGAFVGVLADVWALIEQIFGGAQER